jgi:Zn-dependent protease with chaperone function
MTEDLPAVPAPPPLQLLLYQTRIVDFLKRHDRDVWNWFASSRQRVNHAEELRFELLKSTYRLERDSQPALYGAADEVAQKLGLAAPITIYQAQDPMGLNASLAYLPSEIHVILHGPIATQLTPLELRGLLGHELTHFLLLQSWDGDLLTAAEMLAALANDNRAHPAHFASWRLLKLYNEILCDRGAFVVTQDLGAVVSMLVKVQTGVPEASAESYLRQAEEIFARGPAKTEGMTHPEAFIRARAIKLWVDQVPAAEEAIAAMIDTDADLQQLDLLAQERMAGWTRRVIDLLLAHKWFQTDPVLAHARLYFDDYSPPDGELSDANLSREIGVNTKSVRDYFCFVLLDFVSADRELDEPSLAAALQVAEQLEIKDRLIELARQELKLRKNQIERVDNNKDALIRDADKAAAAT